MDICVGSTFWIRFNGCLAFCSMVAYCINQLPGDEDQVVSVFQWVIVNLDHVTPALGYPVNKLLEMDLLKQNVTGIIKFQLLPTCPLWM